MAIALLLALLVLAVAVPEAAAKGPQDIGCGGQAEGAGRYWRTDPSRDVVRGPMTLMGARRLQQHRVPIARTRFAPLEVMLEADHEGAIVIAPESRELATLSYVMDGHRLPEDVQVTFWACRSGGAAPQARTIWGGGLRIRRPGCVRLLVWVDREAVDDVRIPAGRPCRPPAEIRTVGCAERAMDSFPDAYSDPRNLVFGPMSLVGGAEAAAAETILEQGFWKAPLLLHAGSRVALSVAWESRRDAAIAFGSSGERRAMRFTACDGSDAAGVQVTFWSGGFALRRLPACVAFDLWIEDEPARRVRLPFGSPSACRT